MKSTDTTETLDVEGWALHLSRSREPGSRWRITLCDRILNPETAFMEQQVRTATLHDELIRGLEFDTPEDAASHVRGLLAS